MSELERTRPQPEPAPATGASAPAPQTAKSIVLFSDGTGNSSGKLFKTNVFRLYEAVDLGPTQPGQQRQIAYYDDGVGTSAFRPLRMLQGIFGFGLKRNVLQIYSYACRNYNPDAVPLEGSGIGETGDHIYGFGFSRGAFTMRLVMGLIADQGLIPYRDEEDLQQKVRLAWKRFRRKYPRSIERALGWLGLDEKPPVVTADALGSAKGRVHPPDSRASSYDPADNHRPLIRLIGVWDTVAAVGGPITEITRAIDNFFYRISMPNLVLHPRVRRARHALALDDERDSFLPLLWDEVAEKQLRRKYTPEQAPWLHDDRLQQVWFAGMHSDVGGGYPDESLSYVSLLWMVEEAHKCGLRTVDLIVDRYHGLANSFGPIHNSRAGLAGYYRYQPRRIEAWIDGDESRTLGLRDPAIRDPQGRPKGLVSQVRVHASVLARIASGTDGYSPIVLPGEYMVVPAGGMAETKLLDTSGGKPVLSAQQIAAARLDPPPLVSPTVLGWIDRPNVKRDIAAAMEQAWNYVWKRRITYFATVLATLFLLAIPFGIVERLTWFEPVRALLAIMPKPSHFLQFLQPLEEVLASLIRLVGGPLPDFLSTWFEGWARTPYWSLATLLVVIALMRRGSALERRIKDRSRAIWHSAVPRIPPAGATVEPVNPKAAARTWIGRLRNSHAYQRGVQLFKWLFLPNFVFGPLMLAALLWACLLVVTQIYAPVVEMRLGGCADEGAAGELAYIEMEFETAARCNSAGATVSPGRTYQVAIDVLDPWFDGRYPTDPRGLGAGGMSWGVGYAGAPLRRVLNARYLQPVAAIRIESSGGYGGVEFVPLKLKLSEAEPGRFVGEFEAPAAGRLYLFSNDALLPFRPDFFYAGPGGNSGTACVTFTAPGALPAPTIERGPLCSRAFELASQRAKAREDALPAEPGAAF